MNLKFCIIAILVFSLGLSNWSIATLQPPTITTTIPFYLLNKTSKSIPLIIPTVMNPNLSPQSSSKVSLKVGQKVYFKVHGKKYLLLEVDQTIQADSKIEVSALIKKRKKELGLKK